MCVCVFLLPIQRVTFKYDGSTIVPGEQGAEYQDFIQECTGRETRLLGGIPDLLGNCQRGGKEHRTMGQGEEVSPSREGGGGACGTGQSGGQGGAD